MFRRQLVLPRARRAARHRLPGTSPAGADRGPAVTPGPRGRAGRVVPGATQAPSLGGSPSPVERGKGRPGARPRPGATAMPEEGAGRVSPSPFEGGRARRTSSSRRDSLRRRDRAKVFRPRRLNAAEAEPNKARNLPSLGPSRSSESNTAVSFRGCTAATATANMVASRRVGQDRFRHRVTSEDLERQRFGTPPPLGAAEHQQRGTGPPSGFRQPVTPPPGGGACG